MSITSKGERWELFHSLWIGWTFVPFLYSIAFFNIGFRTGQKKWVAWGTVYLVPFVLFMLALNTSGPYSWQADTTGVPWLLLWPASIFHAFWVRKEYLLRLDTLQSRRGDPDTLLKRRLADEIGIEDWQGTSASAPTITSKGKKWELLHSFWIGWTFTLGALSWVSFFYIALRVKCKRWAAWGLLYSIPFVFGASFPKTDAWRSWGDDIYVFLFFALGTTSVIHAFWIRKEYLLRLDVQQRRKGESDLLLKRRLAAEYGEETRQEDNLSSAASSPAEIAPERGQDATAVPSAQESLSPTRTASQTKNVSPRQSQPTAAPAPHAIRPVVIPPEVLSGSELEYQISSAYPFPLAFGFRSLMSIVDPRDLYREQLRIAENMLAFLASVSLALLREQDRERAGIDPKEFWLTGISPGDWKEIVARCSRVFAGYENDPLASAIKGLSIRSEKKERSFGANMAAFIRAKNDYKHDRGPVVLEDITDASKGVQERLRRCMEALAFSTAYPIRQVEDFDVARRGGVILKCLRYTGDHPSFPQEEIPFHQALPRGDLFIDLGNQGWAPLFPFMTTMTCPHCKVRETYFIDAWDTKRGTARMKSFERGHTMNSTEVFDALSEWTNGIEPEET